MAIVAADTSPINYLVQIGQSELLRILYGRVLLPSAVADELMHEGAPLLVRTWMHQIPGWIVVHPSPPGVDPSLASLDPGERDAIRLALELSANLLLMDDRKAVRLAQLKGLTVTGTLGVLVQAARLNLIDLQASLSLLSGTGFRCSDELLTQVARSVRH